MTNAEAIEEIKSRISTTEYVGGSYVDCVDLEALKLAIKALETQDVPGTNVGDTISKQAAIDAVIKLTYADGAYGYTDAKELVDSLEALPSAQPEIIRCKDCRHRMATPDGDAWICAHPNNNCWRIADEHYCGYAERRTDE